MERINNIEELNQRILELEQRSEAQEVLIKDDISHFVKNLSPAHLIRSTLGQVGGSSDMMQNLVSNISSVVAGYVSKRMIIRRSKGLLGKLGGVFAQFGLTYLIAANADTIGEKAKDLVQTIVKGLKERKKRKKDREEDEDNSSYVGEE